MVEGEADDADAEAGDIGLALAADVEQAAMEGDRDGKAGEDEVGRIVEREGEAGPLPKAPSTRMTAARSGFSPTRSTTSPATTKATTRLTSGIRP